MAIKEGQAPPSVGRHQILESWIEYEASGRAVRIDLIAGYECHTYCDDISKYAGPTGGKIPPDQQSPFGDPGPDVGEAGNG